MELKVQLRLQTILDIVNYLEQMEMESFLLFIVGFLMTPFILCAMWSLGLSILWQLFWLGVKFGWLLFTICSLYFTVSKWTKWKIGAFWRLQDYQKQEYDQKVKCTYFDVVLSVLYQSGFRIPSVIWTPLMDCCILGAKETMENRIKGWKGNGRQKENLLSPTVKSEEDWDVDIIEDGEERGNNGAGDFNINWPKSSLVYGNSDDDTIMNTLPKREEETSLPTALVVEQLVTGKMGRPSKATSRRRRAAARKNSRSD